MDVRGEAARAARGVVVALGLVVATLRMVLGWLRPVAWAGVRWLCRHWRWSVVWTGLVLIAAWVGMGRVAVTAALVAVFPALVCGMWSPRWPASYERFLSGPWRRFRWRRWARRNWPAIARACGLSVESSARRRTFEWSQGRGVASTSRVVRRWHDPRLMDVLTSGGTLTLRVRARLGQSVEEVATAAPKLRDAAGAHSVRCVQHTPSVLDIALVMVDPLAGTRLATPVAAVPEVRPRAARGVGGAVVLGRGEDATEVAADPAAPWHLAIQGATRSGKSALSYTFLGALADRPDVLVCGVDPSGILLAPWLRGRGGAWIATGTADLTGAVTALSGVVAEMDTRTAALVAAGRDKIEVFDAGCPLLLVVLEEYPGTLAAARAQDEAEGRQGRDRIAPRIERLVGRLTKEGAKVGVRLVVLAQRMSAKAVDTDDRSNFGLRVTLRVDNADAVTMLHDGPAARGYVEQARQFPPGMGLVEGPGRPLQRWRADLTDYQTYLTLVAIGIAATNTIPGAFRATPLAVDAAGVEGVDSDRSGPVSMRKPRAPRAPRMPRQRDTGNDAGNDTGDAA